uniref:Uncharacterized protein n=1 Tax=viral metagenome TaxID=1070528 RepID=A0A6C0I2S5_9ZZZZ
MIKKHKTVRKQELRRCKGGTLNCSETSNAITEEEEGEDEIWKSIDSPTAYKRETERIRNAYLLRKTAKLFLKNRQLITGYFLNSICEDSGACLAFGKEVRKINKFFNGFTLTEINSPYITFPIKVKETTSSNGFITEIEFKKEGYKRVDVHNRNGEHLRYKMVKQDYVSHAILKSSRTSKSDNLMYEVLAGSFINTKNLYFPCFLETYGIYKYRNEVAWNEFNIAAVNRMHSKTTITDRLEELTGELDLGVGCQHSKHIAILIQHIKTEKKLTEYLKHTPYQQSSSELFYKYDLLYILFQIYLPLGILKNEFTHYDLHQENVVLYPAKENKYFECYYHMPDSTTIRFKTRFISKILDYGRCYFKTQSFGSREVRSQLCRLSQCKKTETTYLGNVVTGDCGILQGFGTLEPETSPGSFAYICSSKRNMSHDLRLLQWFKNLNDFTVGFSKQNANPELFGAIDMIHYGASFRSNFGISETISSGLPHAINNVNDAYIKLAEIINLPAKMEENNRIFSTFTKMGEIHVYCDQSKPMKYIPTFNRSPDKIIVENE